MVPSSQGAQPWPARGLPGCQARQSPSPGAGRLRGGTFPRGHGRRQVFWKILAPVENAVNVVTVLLPAGVCPGADTATSEPCCPSVPMIADMTPLGPLALRGFPLRSHNGNALISPERPSHKGRVFMFASLPHIQSPGRADTRGGGWGGGEKVSVESTGEVMRSGRRQERPPPRPPEPCPLCAPTAQPKVSAQGESGQVWSPPLTPTPGGGGATYSRKGPSLRTPAAWGSPCLPASRLSSSQ